MCCKPLADGWQKVPAAGTSSDHSRDPSIHQGQLLDLMNSVLQARELPAAHERFEEIASYEWLPVDELECTHYLDGEAIVTTQDSCCVDTNARQVLYVDRLEALFGAVDTLCHAIGLVGADHKRASGLIRGGLGRPPRSCHAFLANSDVEFEPFTPPVEEEPGTDGEEIAREPGGLRAATSTDHEVTGGREGDGTAGGSSAPETEAPADPALEGEARVRGPDRAESAQEATQLAEEQERDPPSGAAPQQTASGSPTDAAGDESAEAGARAQGGPADGGRTSRATSPGTSADRDGAASEGRSNRSRSASSRVGSRSGRRGGGGGGGGGGGHQAYANGKEGERWLVGELADRLAQRAGAEVERSDRTAWIGEAISVTDVSTDRVGYDIHVEGASLSGSDGELGLELGDDLEAHIEAKARDESAIKFHLSSNQCQVAQQDDQYRIVFVSNVQTDPRIKRL